MPFCLLSTSKIKISGLQSFIIITIHYYKDLSHWAFSGFEPLTSVAVCIAAAMPPPPETFTKLKYISDPYKPPIEVITHGNSSKGVKQMTGAKGIKSKLNRLYEGEKPKEAKGMVISKKATECKFLTSDGFRYSSAMKVSNNRGDYTSTFTRNLEHIPISKPETDEDKKETRRATLKKLPAVAKNVSTSPYNEGVFNKIPYVTQTVDKVRKCGVISLVSYVTLYLPLLFPILLSHDDAVLLMLSSLI